MLHTTHTPITPAYALSVLIARGRADLREAKRSTATILPFRAAERIPIATHLDEALTRIAVLEQRVDRASEELLRPCIVNTGRAINILLGHDDVPSTGDCRA